MFNLHRSDIPDSTHTYTGNKHEIRLTSDIDGARMTTDMHGYDEIVPHEHSFLHIARQGISAEMSEGLRTVEAAHELALPYRRAIWESAAYLGRVLPFEYERLIVKVERSGLDEHVAVTAKANNVEIQTSFDKPLDAQDLERWDRYIVLRRRCPVKDQGGELFSVLATERDVLSGLLDLLYDLWAKEYEEFELQGMSLLRDEVNFYSDDLAF